MYKISLSTLGSSYPMEAGAEAGAKAEAGEGLRVQSGSSFRIGSWRCNSSRLVSESVSAECARIAKYERLSESEILTYDRTIDHAQTKSKRLGFLGKIFSSRKASVEVEEKRKKKRSSWLPDPKRRWPVQGWG
ncbi:hypothetical protein SLEP1_g31475 [Rubroshorea leprosula]|uniref:Uncharacterized protein n=1 Tax=Rubroshorea leprosula TaxID=152421 RepID=A0AAV5KAI8_9ROSI|nr:hypothetical protein SLEP1_g31475 [Rubroshorea leprosula]